jgi:pentatricopeptide repeat protein
MVESIGSTNPSDVFAWLEEQEHTASVGSRGYNEALAILSKAGDVNGCVRIVHSMVARGIKVHRTTMNSVIAACAKAGDGAAAEAWWRRMQDVGHAPNRATYGSVIHAWVKAGSLPKAEEWLIAMRNAGFVPPKGFARPIAYMLLGKALSSTSSENDTPEVDLGQTDYATRWLLRFRDLGMNLDRPTMNLLMSVYAKHGDADKAEQWVYHMNQAGIQPNQSTFNALVLANTRAGNLDAALRWMREMQQLGFETPSDQMISENLRTGSPPSLGAASLSSSTSLTHPGIRENFQSSAEGAMPSGRLQQGLTWARDVQHAPPESTLANGSSRPPRVEGLSMTVLPRTGVGWDMANFATDMADFRTLRNTSSYFQSQNHSMQAPTSHAADADYLSQSIAASPQQGGGKNGHVSRSGKGKGKARQFSDRGSSGKGHHQEARGRGHQGARAKGAHFGSKQRGKGAKSKSAGKLDDGFDARLAGNQRSSSSYAGDIAGDIGRIPVPMGLVDSNAPCNFVLRQSF